MYLIMSGVGAARYELVVRWAGSCPAWWHGSSRAGRTAPGRRARVPARDLRGCDGPAPSAIL